ncbi:MAG TPA: EAL domain-containing protein [Mycobacteriales bacterium]|nr:EAL domain-containing protein [Mycobacteriales bacterium]
MTTPADLRPADPTSGGPARIVVVDDVEANVNLLRHLLNRAGHASVDGFTDPYAALGACAAEPPDLVLLDLHMPALDGLGFLERLPGMIGDDAFVPVIVLTADICDEARRKVLSAGAKDFLTKPFDVTEVLLRVRNTLDISSAYREARHHAASLQQVVDGQRAGELAEAARQGEHTERIAAALRPDGLSVVYQPIVSLDTGTVVGAEALARFAGSPDPASEWFEAAAAIGCLAQLELRAAEEALGGLRRIAPDMFLSLNVSPATAAAGELYELLADIPASRVVLELSEHSRIEDYASLNDRLQPFVRRGGRIAIDDAGAGYAGLSHLVHLRPHIIKLDVALTRSIDTDVARQALTISLVRYAAEINATIVAEGIETAAELATLRNLGVSWGQGRQLTPPVQLPRQRDRSTSEADLRSAGAAGPTG